MTRKGSHPPRRRQLPYAVRARRCVHEPSHAPPRVMPARVAGIHVLAASPQAKTWMAGTTPGHDEEE